MSTIDNFFGILDKLESIDIAVNQNRCILVRNRNAQCMKCAEACTSGCISFDGERLTISPEKCIGCGTCATVCPTCALEANHPSDRELYAACVKSSQNAGGKLTIACEQLLDLAEGLVDPEKIVGVKCLGRVEESLLILMARAGAQQINLVHGHCEQCEHKPGSRVCAKVCATANELLGAWRQKEIVRFTDKLPTETRADKDHSYGNKRRAFLSEMFETAKDTAKATVEVKVEDVLGADEPQTTEAIFQKVQDDGTLPHFLPHRRNRLLQGLASFGQPDDVMIDTRLWGHVIIDPDKCTSCQMCATFCPTEALHKFTSSDGTFGVRHYPSRCVKCQCCKTICPADAITISEEVFAVDMLSRAYEEYPMAPRPAALGGHQMLAHFKNLVPGEYIYER